MNDSDRQLLLAVSGLLHYPDDDFFVQARSFEELCDLLSVVRACPLREFIRSARSKGLSRLREEHVAIFDMDSKCSLSLAWHRYGDDPRLGRALAGLNELYRDAGFEPVQGLLPDYLPLVLEFFAAAPDWARVVLLLLINGCTGFYQAYVAHFPVFVTVGPWLRSLVVFRPDVVLMETVPLFLQIHVVSAFTLFALIPFSRLVHIFSVPVTYALRPFQIYRRRYAGL